MATITTIFNNFLSLLFILLLHLGCFIFITKQENSSLKKRKISPLSQPSSPTNPKFKTHKALSSSWHFIKHLFSIKSTKTTNTTHLSPQSESTAATTTVNTTAAAHSLNSGRFSQAHQESDFPDPRSRKITGSGPESDISADNNLFFPLRNDIFPCTACGEVFQKPNLLEQHQTIKHALSELSGSDPGHNIVQIIFKSGWPENSNPPNITRILKINNSTKILSKFEEYREIVKAKAARAITRRRDERCIADGNELMRFHCSTFLCELGLNGDSKICSQQFCNICGIIKSGFSSKLDGISTMSSSWKAHMSIPEEVEQEFHFMNVKRAMLVCRVIAGWVGSVSDEVDKQNGEFDSLMARGGCGVHTRLDEEELLVFNPRAVLPCFVIVYGV
ncbi:putative transcription factor C2H2 family [Lupinus albus]|uniref:Putative transcription factor C2H2 family n=1 Tax=Lupinus albus TaxID=3870 RepID=A0A6A4NYE4_LUPAL|nr:putative transcription factor C2H2 family [Lupinus albus]